MDKKTASFANANALPSSGLRTSPLLELGVWFIVAFLLFFCITYALKAWFFQDDFGFTRQYAHSLEAQQLLSLENFGRFVSRNVYWHVGLRYFSHNAECFSETELAMRCQLPFYGRRACSPF